MKKLVLIVCVLGLFVFVVLGTRKERVSHLLPLTTLTPTQTPVPTPTPFPFQELTIPALRTSYVSSLGERTLAYDTPSYTAYVTRYTAEGLQINGLLTEPKGDKPEGGWPAIIFVHGYIPPTQYRTLERYRDHVDYLASRGFVVFKIDLRGHGESEGEPGGAYYSADYVIDTLHAYAALETSGFVNPQRIGLWGHSMAGNVVLRSMAAKPEIPAGVIWAGAVYTYQDFQEYGIADASYVPPPNASERQRRRQILLNTYGQPSAGSFFWKQMAPTTFVGDMKGAIQLHHAIDDEVVSINYSRNLNTILNASSVPHELYEYSFGGHNITGASFVAAMQRTVEFFRIHLAS